MTDTQELVKRLREWSRACQVGIPRKSAAYDELHALLAGLYPVLHQAADALERQSEVRDQYHDLLYQVASKFPGESRHETAKRYIQAAEMSSDEAEVNTYADPDIGE